MGKQEELLRDLATELQQLAAEPLKWTSPDARSRAEDLQVIWYELVELSIPYKPPLYREIQKLQLEVLSQMSRLDADRYKLFRKQFSGGLPSFSTRINLAMIRLRSKTDRTFEKIDRVWIGREEARRANETESE